jgi:UDP-N-acetylmuramyl tripeptide synthase
MGARTLAAIWAGKAAGAASRVLRRGGGTAIAGVVAERIDPAIVGRLLRSERMRAIAVTGTNGKTTTALMLSDIAQEAGLEPLHNRSGSNLMRGIAATLVEEATLGGRIPDATGRNIVLEVDEATLPLIVRAVAPRALLFTNLFRDQLDRYGEVDTVARAWERALAAAPAETTVVLNADDPAVAHLGRAAPGRVIYYGIDDTSVAGTAEEHASDFRTCLDCGAELRYDATFYGHVGHWRCPSCGNARPAADVAATAVREDDGGLHIDVRLPDIALTIELPLSGLYNAYNALAALAGGLALGLPAQAAQAALGRFSAAFGRQERFAIEGRDVRVLLGKNPTGLNQVLRTLAAHDGERRILFFLNDNVADGRDVSWIWDADYELVRAGTAWTLAAGTRAEDLALRLKYAGFGDDVPTERDTTTAIRRAIDATPPGATLHVVPTYTAMLDVRELLARRGGAARFWERA